MNHSYCRIKIPQSAALERFAAWQHLSSVGPLVPTDSVKAVDLACDENGDWRGNAVFISEVGGWTLFSDLSGALSGVSPDRWLELAGSDELIFAGYNDAAGFAEFVLVRDGRILREFIDDPDEPDTNVNVGKTDVDGEPFESWEDVAVFVDGDELGYCDEGLLWVWR